jgi:hypothetical protein
VKLIFGDKELIVNAGKGVFDQSVILGGAEEDADRRIVVRGHDVASIPAHIGVKLANILVAELHELQFDEDVAFQDAVVEHQIDGTMYIVN